MIVVDASALTSALANADARGKNARAELARDPAWAAPEHWKVEVFHALRGLLLGGKITESRAQRAVQLIPQLAFAPVDLDRLLPRMWQLRGNVSGYDAAYVAAAEHLGCELVTGDARLARSGGLRCPVRVCT